MSTTTSKRTTADAAAQASIGVAARELHLPTVRTEAVRLAEIADRERQTHLRYLAEVLAAEVDDRTERRRARRDMVEHRRRSGSLEGDKRPVELLDKAAWQILAKIDDIDIPPCGVDHEKQIITNIGDHQIVKDTAIIIGQHRIAHASGGKSRDVAWHKGLKPL